MAYDYDPRSAYRGRERGDWRDRDGRARDNERGFFERAGDEIASWFGDDDAERRRDQDDRSRGGNYERGYHGDPDQGSLAGATDIEMWPAHERGRRDRDEWRGAQSGRDRQRDEWRGDQRDQDRRGWFGRQDDQRERLSRSRSYGPPQSYGAGYDRTRSEQDDRPLTGDDRRGPSRAYGRGDFGDPHYNEWRQRQLDDLDRDYDEYRREHQSKFAQDFGNWRTTRQSKRQLLGQVREHMEVVGSDEQHVGIVDQVEGDRVILTRSDPEAGGVHRSLSCALVDRVDNDKLVLDRSADDARSQLQREPDYRDPWRASATRTADAAGSPSDGPHVLERSFSGTYR